MASFEAELMAPVPKKSRKVAKKSRRVSEIDDDDLAGLVDVPAASSSRHSPPLSMPPPKAAAEPSMFDPSIFKRKDRTKVYAGRTKNTGLKEVPTLIKLCQRMLLDHIDDIDELGDTPIDLLRPIIEKCSMAQLERICEKNRNRADDLDEFWARHVDKQFHMDETAPQVKRWRGKKYSWAKIFKRLSKEREQKLQAISQRIQQRTEEAAAPVRRTIMSDVINPTFARKRQQRNGITTALSTVPTALEVTRARREVFNTGSKAGVSKLVAVNGVGMGGRARNVAIASGSRGIAKPQPPKMGALMAKTLKMMKSQRR